MTKFLSMLTLVAVMSLPTIAQEMTTKKVADRGNDIEDVNKYNAAKLEMETRSIALNVLGLTAEEINDFDPLYNTYKGAKESIEARRNILVAQYKEEMAEDDTVEDETNETGDFIEDYMELDIAMMELKKDMFDKFEDIVGPQKALDFFAMEDMFINRAKRKMVMDALPTLYLVPVNSVSYQRDIDAYRNWKQINIDGKVNVGHEFTYNGLEKLLTAAEKMAMTEGISVDNFNNRKQMIMDKAGKLKENWKSLSHADLAKEAFTATASLLSEIATDSRFDARMPWINKLSNTAGSINVNEKLTDQADTVYSFFDTAEMIINDLVSQANDAK